MLMTKSIPGVGKKVLSLLLVFAMLFSLLPSLAPPAKAAASDEYTALVSRMGDARDNILALADTYGEIDFGNGYTLDLKAELNAFAVNIDHDLGVAAAIVGGVYNDTHFAEVNNSNTGSTYTQANFNAAFGATPDERYGDAVTYLTQGGISVVSYSGTISKTLNYFFSYYSKLNPGYTAKATTGIGGSMSESGKSNIVVIAENYPATLSGLAPTLTVMVDTLKGYITEANALQDYFLTLACSDEDCEDGEDCMDWAHRLLVSEEEFTDAVEKFIADIERDIKIVGVLATGKIYEADQLHFGYKNGSNYYNNTAAGTTAAKMAAAISFLNDGGYNCGSYTTYSILGQNLYLVLDNQLSYSSSFSDYNVTFSDLLGTGFEITNDNTPVLSLVDGTLSILKSGATADNLSMVYDFKVAEIRGYIKQVEALIDTAVPSGGSYTQEEFEAAIESFLDGANRDLYIAGILKSGEIANDGYPSTFVSTLGDASLISTYKNMSEAERYSNAIRFFNEGGYGYGYSFLGIGYQLEYKSSFHTDYSSGLFGLGSNKTNVIAIMRGTAAALTLGNKYMTSLERAKDNYEQSLAQLEAVKDDPSGIVSAVLKTDGDLNQLVADLNLLIGSLDDIVSIIDTINSLGIGRDILDPILSSIGLSYDMLEQLAGLRVTLNNLGIDTSGEVTIEESLEPIVGSVVGVAIDIAISGAKAVASLGTESAYTSAAAALDGTYDTLTKSAASTLTGMLALVMPVVESIRPYLNMLESGISLINNVLALVDQVNALLNDFTVGGLSESTETLADTLNDLADLMEAFDKSALGSMLAGLWESMSTDIGGSVTGALAELLDGYLEGLIGVDLGLSDLDLGFISDTINGTIDTLVQYGLGNPTALVPLLRASANILYRISELEGGVQSLLDGEFKAAFEALTSDLGGMITYTVELWNALLGLFSTTDTQAELLMAEDLQLVTVEAYGLDGGDFLTALGAGLNDEAMDTFRVLCDPKVSHNDKSARLEAFKQYVKDVKAFVSELKATAECLEDMCKWADKNMTKDSAKAFAEKLVCHYAKELYDCIKDGISNSKLPQIIEKANEIAAEISDIVCLIKSTGALEIYATAGDDDVFYLFATNYDDLRARLEPVLDALGITVKYRINYKSDEAFYLDGNALKADSELDDGDYDIKVAYKLFFDVCLHDFAITLATKSVVVSINAGGGGDEAQLTGIYIKTPPATIEYTVGEALDLTGLVVTAQFDDGIDRDLDLSGCTLSPAPGDLLNNAGTITVTVTYNGFEATFEIIVNEAVTTPFSVVFDADNGTLSTGAAATVTAGDGEQITLPGATRSGHTFNGWYDGTIRVGGAGDLYIVVKTVTLTASWTYSGGNLNPNNNDNNVEISDEDVPLGDRRALMSLDADGLADGIVYYYDGDEVIFVPFCLTIEDKIYFFGEPMIEYFAKENPKEFTDIDDHWAYEDTLFAASREVFQGYPDGSFLPDGTMTRAMFATVLARMSQDDISAYTVRAFDDVDPSAWYGSSVAWAAANGIVFGVGDDMFAPDDSITRQEIAVMLARFLNYMGILLPELATSPFTDEDMASDWALDAIREIQRYGIVSGKPGNEFDPLADCTRAEIAVILHRLIVSAITGEYNATLVLQDA